MKKKSILLPSLLVCGALGIGGVLGYQCLIAEKPISELFSFGGSDKDAKSDIPGSYIGSNLKAEDWKDTTALRDRLGKEILSIAKDTSKKQVKEFMTVPQNRLLVAQWMLAHLDASKAEAQQKWKQDMQKQLENKTKDLENLNKSLEQVDGTQMAASIKRNISLKQAEIDTLKEELAAPFNMQDAMADPATADLMGKICNNLDWMNQLCFSGENTMPARAVYMLSRMVKKEPKLLTNAVDKDTATATALEFSRYNWEIGRAVDRALYFIKHTHDGRLNDGFAKLNFFLRRMTCGWKGNHDSGYKDAFEWALDNVHLPADRYPGSCWRCGYRLNNVFGDSIHGSNYYEPFVDQYAGNHFLKTYEVGGVCGGLSHFGAAAACANGVPAMTAGEPGHCAYIVYVDGKWTPAYSLSWQRGLHWQPFSNVHVYSTLHAAEKLYSEDEKNKTAVSNAYRVLAGIYATNGSVEKAVTCYDRAESVQPLNFIAWREHADLLKEKRAEDADDWTNLNKALCKRLVPIFPEVAAEWARQNLCEGLGKAVTEQKDRMAAAKLFWNSVEEMGVDRWRIEELAESQMKMVYAGKKDITNDDKIAFYKMLIGATVSKAPYAPHIMAWGNTISEKMDEKSKQKILAASADAFGGGKGMDEKQKGELLKQLFVTAESMRDVNTFQSLSKLLPAAYIAPKDKLPNHEPFPGKLVSKGGVFFPSSTCGHDDYLAHWGILEPTVGGRFHTGNEENAWGAVRLPKHANITGVVVIATCAGQNLNRLDNMKIQISDTGKPDDWHDVGTKNGKMTGNTARFDLSGQKPKALYVRVLREGKNFFHFNGLFVYGTPAA